VKNKKIIKRLVVIFVSVLLIVAIGYTSVRNIRTTAGENLIGTITSPFQKISYNVGRVFSNSYESILEIYKVREENDQLKNRIYELKNQNRILLDIVENKDFLENEYKMRESLDYDYIKAQIISRDPNNWFQKFNIDKGSKDDVKIDDIVVHAAEIDEGLTVIGLVGKVIDVGNNWSKIITITDINSSLSFRNIRNNSSGILKGQIDNSINGYTFSKEDDINIGDVLVTSGLGEIYTHDIYIGEVVEINRDSTLTNNIVVEPVIDFEELHNVYILRINR